jgi:hypothetical protein
LSIKAGGEGCSDSVATFITVRFTVPHGRSFSIFHMYKSPTSAYVIIVKLWRFIILKQDIEDRVNTTGYNDHCVMTAHDVRFS